jgi:uncharacterized DUF497 family protein
MKISWDPPKRLANLLKHGHDFASLPRDFFNGAAIIPVRKGRFKAVGSFDGLDVAVIFAPLGREAVSVISMRRANRSERRHLK